MSGAEMIARERQRQVTAEHWTPDHDDEHAHGELAMAAIAYVLSASDGGLHLSWNDLSDAPTVPDSWWPWPIGFKSDADPVRDLVKAGALIAAEIDRIMRADLAPGEYQ